MEARLFVSFFFTRRSGHPSFDCDWSSDVCSSDPPPMMVPPSRAALSTDLGFAEQEGGLDWNRVLSAVLRFKWLIVAVTVVGTAARGAGMRVLSAADGPQASVWSAPPRPRHRPASGP